MQLVAGIPPQHRPFLCWRAVSFVAVFCETFRVNVRARRFDNATGGLGSTWDVRHVIPFSHLFAGVMEGRCGTWQDNQAESESDNRSEFSIEGLDSDEHDGDPRDTRLLCDGQFAPQAHVSGHCCRGRDISRRETPR